MPDRRFRWAYTRVQRKAQYKVQAPEVAFDRYDKGSQRSFGDR